MLSLGLILLHSELLFYHTVAVLVGYKTPQLISILAERHHPCCWDLAQACVTKLSELKQMMVGAVPDLGVGL